MRIAVIGTGYVGLVTGTCFADSGNKVVCVDNDASKVRSLLDGIIPIYEPGLEELVLKNVRDGRLSFTDSYAEAVPGADIVFIAVGTPTSKTGEDADLRYVLAAAKEIGANLTGYAVVTTKSTVPVGTSALVAKAVAETARHPFDVASNPEFLKEGAAIDDFMRPDRVVVGTSSDRAKALFSDLYGPFVRTENPILFMDMPSAELTKYAANSMLALRISFMNDIATLCEKVGADVDLVRKGIGSDSRIGYPFLFPGVGYGGSCFGKDVLALISTADVNGLNFQLLREVENVNRRQKLSLANKVRGYFGDLRGLTLCLWGLAFKPKTDDMRDAPSLTIVESLLASGATIKAFDPVASDAAARIFENRVMLCEDMYEAAEDASGVLLVTEWNEFRRPDFERLKTSMKAPVLFDGRNIWNPQSVRNLGFTYFGIGRP